MTLSEASTLKKGTKVQWKEDGYIITGTFKGLCKCCSFGKMTFSNIANFDPGKGKEEIRAMVEYVWDNGKTYEASIRLRALRVADDI